VPQRAVVDTGSKKVVYVEREPGMFEGVEVELGPRYDDYYPVLKGLAPGDKVAAAGGFLIDAETRLNPAAAATYFGARGGPQSGGRPSAPSAGATGGPSASAPSTRADKVPVAPGEQAPALTPGPSPKGRGEEKPDQPPAHAPRRPKAEPEPRVAVAAPDAEDLKNIEQLPEADRQLAVAQRTCPVTGAPLGSMGVPVKITLRGQTVFLCCKGCAGKAKKEPEETLRRLSQLATTKPQ
jgi:hypothetical protein